MEQEHLTYPKAVVIFCVIAILFMLIGLASCSRASINEKRLNEWLDNAAKPVVCKLHSGNNFNDTLSV
jgi:Flp pilus assembly protein TadB